MTISGFKKIYFTAMALVTVVLLVFSFVTYYNAGGSTPGSTNESIVATAQELAKYDRSSQTAEKTKELSTAGEYIESQLSGITNLGIKRASENKDDSKYTKITNLSTYDGAGPYYVVQDFDKISRESGVDLGVDIDTCQDMAGSYSNMNVYGAKQLKNYIVIIPGTGKDGAHEAVLFMTHYDSMPKTEGATNAVNVAAMLETISQVKGKAYENDLVFVFTDGRYDSSVSAYAFKNQFVGFDNVFGRIKAAFNFDALTAGGHLSLVQTSENASAIVNAYASCSGSSYADTILTSLNNYEIANSESNIRSDFDIFYDINDEVWVVPALNFMYTNGYYDAEGKYDTFADIDAANVAAQSATLMLSLADKFGGIDLGNMNSGMTAAAATYLNVTVSANSALMYVLATLLLVILAGTLYFAFRKKAFSLSGAIKGIALVLGVMVAAVGIFYAAYFLMGLLMSSLGVLTIQMLFTLQYLGLEVLIPSILFAAAVVCGLYPFLKRSFKVKATDCVRGASLILTLLAIVTAYAYPAAALGLIIAGFCTTAVMLALVFLKAPVKGRFGVDIERFMPYAWPMMFALPFAIPFILSISNLYLTIFFPVAIAIIALLISCVTPYFDYLQIPLSKVFSKLPKHKIVIEQDVSREVEDVAKKGRFETVTTREIITKEVKWKYHNWFGVTVLCTVTAITLFLCSTFGGISAISLGRSAASTYGYSDTVSYDAIYNNAMVYVAEKGGGSVSTAYWLIKDTSLFVKAKNVRDSSGWYFLNQFVWDESKQGYRYDLTYDEITHPVTSNKQLCTAAATQTDGVYTVDVTPASTMSQAVMTFTLTGGASEIRVRNETDNYSIEYKAEGDKVTITLPYGYGNCSIDFVGYTGNSISLSATQYIFNKSAVQAERTLQYIDAMDEYMSATYNWEIDYGVVIKYSHSV